MQRIRFIAHKPDEAEARAKVLRQAGYKVDIGLLGAGTSLRGLAQSGSTAVVIDLDRMPSYGKAVAGVIRKTKSTRHIPLVMVGGDPKKLPAIQEFLPDAVFTAWASVLKAIPKAIANPPANPVVRDMSIISHRPLIEKLGIKAGMRVVAPEAPREFFRALGSLPEDVIFEETGKGDLTIRFFDTCNALQQEMRSLAALTPLWICWPKQSALRPTDLTMIAIRDIAFTAGLVDYKVCAINAVWSGMLLGKRRK